MPKLFVFSDVHSYYDELQEALQEAGYDNNNKDHWLISCGDNFDRGTKAIDMLHFLYRSPRIITIRGNHEDLLEDLIYRGFPYSYDKSNRTYQTVKALADNKRVPFDVACDQAKDRIRHLMIGMQNYFETEHYIFVHGWIPMLMDETCHGYDSSCKSGLYYPKWRDATKEDWDIARWQNGIAMQRDGIIEPNKTIVCGHWHCSYGNYLKALDEHKIQFADAVAHDEYYYEFGEGANFDPYYNKGIIAIDACTAHSKKVNVIVLDDEFIGDKTI